MACYVHQLLNALLHRFTVFQLVQVKETIMTSALLRLPLSISRREKMERVSNIIAQLVSRPETLPGHAI